jgi:amino acid transporter
VLPFAGVEGQAVHVIDIRSPSRGYPAVIGWGALISVLIFALGALPIAAILPYEKISLQSGVFDAFGAVLVDIWRMGWAVSTLSLLFGVGAISGVQAWLGSPSRGLLETAHEGELPPILQAKNRKDMPTHILLVQGLIVTVISCFYFVIQDVSVRSIALYLIAYMHDVCGGNPAALLRTGFAAPLYGAGWHGRHVADCQNRLCWRAVQLCRFVLPAGPVAGRFALVL